MSINNGKPIMNGRYVCFIIRKYFNKWYKQHIVKKRTDKELPYNCITCELLGICRDRDNEWKCKKGCLLKRR